MCTRCPAQPIKWDLRRSRIARFERYLKWLRSPLAIIVQAMIASTFCGLFLHPQGFLLGCGLGAVLAVGVAWNSNIASGRPAVAH